MKPNTRLLIQFRFSDGSMKGWGYDYPYYNKLKNLQTSITRDFAEDFPENDEIHLFYYTHDTVVEANNAEELAEKAVEWLQATGDYNGN